MTAGTVVDSPTLDAGPDLPAPDERGTTVVLPRAVERVAAQAVREVADATGAGRRVLGRAVGTTGTDTAAHVSAHIDGNNVALDVEMTVIYPAPVLDVTRRARGHIVDRVVQLTGLQVRRVDIAVVGMSVQRPAARRVR